MSRASSMTTTATTTSPSVSKSLTAPVDPLASLPFNLASLKASIPAHCFEKNLWTSIYYLIRDFAFIACMYALYPYVNKYGDAFGLMKFLSVPRTHPAHQVAQFTQCDQSTPAHVQYAMWQHRCQRDGLTFPFLILHFFFFVISFFFSWWNVTGFFGWCLFVVGHDCGHRTFCDDIMLCDIFGHIAHTPLLVPFHGWRVSHRKHHENHNHVENDHSWRPIGFKTYLKYMEETFSARIARIVRFSHALLVIFPLYLIMDSEFTSGNHFNPFSSVQH